MIKVIKHGTKKQTTCKECGCVFTYEKEDTKEIQCGMNEYEYFVVCPDCQANCTAGYLGGMFA